MHTLTVILGGLLLFAVLALTARLIPFTVLRSMSVALLDFALAFDV